MSFESAKKHGYRASVLNVILPAAAIIMSIASLVALFYQIATNPQNTEPITFLSGFIIGFSIVIAIAGIAALILFMLSMHRLSNYYKEPTIFKNILYAFLLSIIGGITSSIITIFMTTSLSTSIINNATPEYLGDTLLTTLMSIITVYTLVLSIALIFAIISGFLYYRAFNKLGEKSGIEKFKTAGLLYLIGSVLLIMGAGSIITWIAWIFAAQGYKQLKPQPTFNPENNPTTTTTPQPNTNKIYCSYCGTENNTNINYCHQCGQPLHTTQTNTPTN